MYYRDDSPEYAAWRAMRQRCNNPKHEFYHRYGGRGIKVCRQWGSFSKFMADMGPRPDGMTLERVENDVGYTPENCVWGGRVDQCRNRSTTRMIEYCGERLCVQEWADRLGMNKRTLRERLERGWTIQAAIETPVLSQFSGRKKVPSEDQERPRVLIRRTRAGI